MLLDIGQKYRYVANVRLLSYRLPSPSLLVILYSVYNWVIVIVKSFKAVKLRPLMLLICVFWVSCYIYSVIILSLLQSLSLYIYWKHLVCNKVAIRLASVTHWSITLTGMVPCVDYVPNTAPLGRLAHMLTLQTILFPHFLSFIAFPSFTNTFCISLSFLSSTFHLMYFYLGNPCVCFFPLFFVHFFFPAVFFLSAGTQQLPQLWDIQTSTENYLADS